MEECLELTAQVLFLQVFIVGWFMRLAMVWAGTMTATDAMTAADAEVTAVLAEQP